MKYKTVQEKITAIHQWTLYQHTKCSILAEKLTNQTQKAMLKGKSKAYLDCACLIQCKYGKYLLNPKDIEKIKNEILKELNIT